jgi:hypothetical protein
MSLRNQPYLPLYVDDFLSDEKLVFCSAAATGVYIRLLCLMHKSEEYGKILLKQKFKQTSSNLKNFASQLAVQMPYDYQTILFALEELVCTKVLQEEPCAISQRRMVKDNEISEKRALSGKKGGEKSLGKNRKTPPDNSKKTEDFALDFAQAKTQANYVIVNTIENNNRESIGGVGEKREKKEEKVKFAEFVSMTNGEYSSLVTELGSENAAKECVRMLDNYKGSSGKKYKSDYRAILNWVIDKFRENEKKQPYKRVGQLLPPANDAEKNKLLAKIGG